MKYARKLVIPILIVVLAAAPLVWYYAFRDTWDTTDPVGVLKQARAFALEGQYEKALKRYKWIREWYDREGHLGDPGYMALRDYVITYWCDLSKDYPKAREALGAVRDENEKMLGHGHESIVLFKEVLIINHFLQDEPRSISLFKAIHRDHPQLATTYYWFAENNLVQAREYQLCAKYIQDATAAFRTISQYRDFDLKLARGAENLEDRKKEEQHADKAFVQRVEQLLEILAGSGRLAEATEIHNRALAVRSTPEARAAFEEALRRASK